MAAEEGRGVHEAPLADVWLNGDVEDHFPERGQSEGTFSPMGVAVRGEGEVPDKPEEQRPELQEHMKDSQKHTLWTLVVPLVIPCFLYAASFEYVTPILPIYGTHELHDSPIALGALVAGCNLGRLLGNIPGGYLTARFSPKPVILAALFVDGMCNFLSIVAGETAPFATLRGVAGFGLGWFLVARSTYLADHVQERKLGLVTSALDSTALWAGIPASIAGAYVTEDIGAAWTFGLQGITSLLAMSIVAAALRSDGRSSSSAQGEGRLPQEEEAAHKTTLSPFYTTFEETKEAPEEDHPEDGASTTIRFGDIHGSAELSSQELDVDSDVESGVENEDDHESGVFGGTEGEPADPSYVAIFKANWKFLVRTAPYTLPLLLAMEARHMLVPLYGDRLGLEEIEVGLIVAFGFFTHAATFPISGYIMDKVGRKYAGVPSAALTAVGFLSLPYATDALSLAMAAAFIGFALGIGGGVVMTIGTDAAPRGCASKFIALYRIAADAGAAIGPIAAGWATEWYDLDAAAGCMIALSVFAAAWMCVFVPETKPKSSRDEGEDESALSLSERARGVKRLLGGKWPKRTWPQNPSGYSRVHKEVQSRVNEEAQQFGGL